MDDRCVARLQGTEVAAAVRDNPLAPIADHPSRLLLMASPDPRAMAQLKPLLKKRWAPEAFAPGPRFAYLDILFVSELPHTATGKLQKLKLRELYCGYRPSGFRAGENPDGR